MSDGFVSLAAFLKPPLPVEPVAMPPSQCETRVADDDAIETLASDVRCFRARLADAFDAALDDLLRDFACAVLARELTIGPADLAALAADVLERARDESPIALRACADDCRQLQGLELPVIADDGLRSGDLLVELRDGELDLRLGVRIEALLADWRAR